MELEKYGMNFMIDTLNRYKFHWIIKSSRMKWTECMKKREFQSESLKRKLKQKWENNIKIDVKEILCEEVDRVIFV